tara:strand:+ start:51 stop:245 length:195 start_codon:yes stop_codon:yes gene_type:complete
MDRHKRKKIDDLLLTAIEAVEKLAEHIRQYQYPDKPTGSFKIQRPFRVNGNTGFSNKLGSYRNR